MEKNSNISGILVVDKPLGLTSRDVVNRVSRIIKTKKIGHTGTLDPLATGVLVLVVGTCTKLVEYLTSKDKEYVAKMVLGYETDTLDITGETLFSSDKKVSREDIKRTVLNFVGRYDQEVPAFSAVKKDGQRLYEYARAGIEVELPKREVNIISMSELRFLDDEISFKTTVSKGTYIRSLIRDIGRDLGTYATMSSLIRTKQGNFTIEESYTLDEIENGSYKLIEPDEVLSDIRTIELDTKTYIKVANGVKLNLDYEDEFVKFFYEGNLIALYKKEDDIFRMYIKFER